MLIALPNADKSFTCTLFAPWEGKDGLNSLQTDEQVQAYFHKHFPDVVPMIPSLTEQFFAHPSSALTTVQVNPWNLRDKIVLLGVVTLS